MTADLAFRPGLQKEPIIIMCVWKRYDPLAWPTVNMSGATILQQAPAFPGARGRCLAAIVQFSEHAVNTRSGRGRKKALLSTSNLVGTDGAHSRCKLWLRCEQPEMKGCGHTETAHARNSLPLPDCNAIYHRTATLYHTDCNATSHGLQRCITRTATLYHTDCNAISQAV